MYLFFTFFAFGLILRFYNLTWGAPYYFHPDERNIASSITQLSSVQLNPHFFAYGSLPIYTIYFLGVLVNGDTYFHPTNIFSVSFEHAVIIGRIISAFFSLLLIPLLYMLGKKLHDETTGIIAACLIATSIGCIQFAHFATFEMWLTFFTLLLTYYCLCYFQSPSKKHLAFLGILLGILIGIKISSIVLFFPIFILLCLAHFPKNTSILTKLLSTAITFCFVTLIAGLVYIATNPFAILDMHAFTASMQYEGTVALGTLPVFYTQSFLHTTPIVYQLLFVYPFLLGFICFTFFLPALFYCTIQAVVRKNILLGICLLFFYTMFFSQAFFFSKWTRYMVPTLPYIYLLIAYSFVNLLTWSSHQKKRVYYKFSAVLLITGIFGSLLLSLSFVFLVYGQSDTRVQAYLWAKKHISPESQILSEVFDIGIVPFNDTFSNITLFNFYDLDHNASLQNSLHTILSHTEYIVVPSQRIFKKRLQSSDFPQSKKFYATLFFDKTKYEKVYETPCGALCKITYMGDPVFGTEETATIFDRPKVYIFKKL